MCTDFLEHTELAFEHLAANEQPAISKYTPVMYTTTSISIGMTAIPGT